MVHDVSDGCQHDNHVHAESSRPLSVAYQTFMNHNEEETNHLDDVCRSFRQYAAFAMSEWTNQSYRLHSLPVEQQRVLPDVLLQHTDAFRQRAEQMKNTAIRNQFCLDCILRHAGVPHSQEITSMAQPATDSQISKVSSVLKSLARDWSVDGRAEREMVYTPILQQVQTYLPILRHDGNAEDALGEKRLSPPKISVPGSGVGRLAFELTRLGYTVQGNEFSLYMLLASDFILNGGIATPDRPLKISPWAAESRNHHNFDDQMRAVEIPDVDPWAVLCPEGTDTPPDFSMAAGDFAAIYNHPKEANQWDCVACSFFLDAVPSIVEYLQLIYRMLKPGGILINFGPLLFHWKGPSMRPDDDSREAYLRRYSHLDSRYLNSIDVSYEDVRQIMINIGYVFLEETTGIKCLYTADKKSMMNTVYRCVSFVAQKPLSKSKNTINPVSDSSANCVTKDVQRREADDEGGKTEASKVHDVRESQRID